MGRQLDNFEIEAFTKAAYENHRIFCEALGDTSHVPWEFLPDDLKAIARTATIGVITLELDAERSHEAWVNHKRAQGWQRGDVKDVAKKTHPSLCAWSELPYEHQAKDYLWVQTVRNMHAAFIRIPRQ